MSSNTGIDAVFCFDTTGSMEPAAKQVRANMHKGVGSLVARLPNVRVGMIAHRDYDDIKQPGSYVTTKHDLTRNVEDLQPWISAHPSRQPAGDAPECYELALREIRTDFSWRRDSRKVVVLFGDDEPHGESYYRAKPGAMWFVSPFSYQRPTAATQALQYISYEEEARQLAAMGAQVFAVQCLGISRADYFYRDLAEITGGAHIRLDQFGDITTLIQGVGVLLEGGQAALEEFTAGLVEQGAYTRSVDKVMRGLGARGRDLAPVPQGLVPVDPSRFQALKVIRDTPIGEFVRECGYRFTTGRGFYQFTKRVLVQAGKEIILRNKRTGDLFTGEEARRLAGIPVGYDANVDPTHMALSAYDCFIQSTSATRKLLAGTTLLYDVRGL